MARSKSKQKRKSLQYKKARTRLEERKKRLRSAAVGLKPSRSR
jgi:hypothetical protein